MLKIDQQIKILGENVIWMNQFFTELFSLLRNITRAFKDQGLSTRKEKYWHPSRGQGDNKLSIPQFWILYMNGNQATIHVFAVLDPNYIAINHEYFERAPSLVVVVHPDTDPGKQTKSEDVTSRVLRKDMVDFLPNDNDRVTGYFRGGLLKDTPFYAYQVSLEHFVCKEDTNYTDEIMKHLVEPAKDAIAYFQIVSLQNQKKDSY